MSKQLKGIIQLTLCSLIWGCAFVAQSVAMDSIGPYTFIFLRFALASVVLIPIIFLFKDKSAKDDGNDTAKDTKKNTVKGGIICGVFLFSASACQQIGIMNSSVGKAGFITALYIILVPILSIFLKKKIGLNVWISALIATIGFYIMCITGKTTLQVSDLLLLACAFLFAMQILAVDKYVTAKNGIVLSLIQFIVSFILGFIFMIALESPDMSSIKAALIPILYAGIMSSGVAYTLQILGQSNLDPTPASLLMSLESVFSALAGLIILKELLTLRELTGCVLVFAGVILAQIPNEQFKKKKQ